MTATIEPTTATNESTEPAHRTYSHREILEILVALLMAMLTAMVSTSVIGTALPVIVGELGGQEQLAWAAAATLLTMTASTPIWGKLSDRHGRKLLFQIAVGTFLLSSVAAGFAQDMPQLIAARAVQGLGVGGIMSLSQVILGDVVAPRERGRYTGYIGATFGVSTVGGPLLGGFLVDSWLGWRWCFWISVPMAAAAFLIVQRALKLPRPPRPTDPVDWAGATLLTAGTTTLLLLLTLGGHEFAWTSPWSWGLGAGTVVAVGLAVVAERRAADPILPPQLFRNRTIVLTATAGVLVGVCLFGGMIYLPQYLQVVKGMSPSVSGLMTMPMVLGLMTSSIIAGQIVTRTGRWKVFPVVGMVSVTVAMGMLAGLTVDTGRLYIGVGLALLGIGLGLSIQTLVLAAQNAVPRNDMAAATASATYFRSLGGAVGVAALGAVLTNRLADELAGLMARAHIALPASGGGGGGGGIGLGTPDAINQLPPELRDLVLIAFSRAQGTVFLVAVPVAALAVVAVLLLRELPLRSDREPTGPPP
jgi:EmrB/QacA subfamily drug resistance transporter